MGKKALLMILDGWGIGDHTKSDAIYSTPTPYWDSLLKTYPNSKLQASGENVVCPTARWATARWVTSTLEPAAWCIKTL